LEQFHAIWNYPLITLTGGGVITVSQIVLVVVIVLAGIFLGRVLQKLLARHMSRTQINPNSAQTIQRLVFYFILVLVFVTALSMLHIPITALAFISGAVAIGIGFGAQNIINNFISGWILMSERPVRIGDIVEIGGANGVIESIGARSTRIRRVDGVHLLVPNSAMIEQTVVNWTLVDKNIRTTIRIGVAYGSSPRQVSELLRQAVDAQPEVMQDPEPVVIFEDFGDSALIFDVYFWSNVDGERFLRQIRSDIRHRITDLFAANGIQIPFPQRDVHIKNDAV
jgi:small-conductance mechanosensitive channel